MYNKFELINIIKYIYSTYEYDWKILENIDEYLVKIYNKKKEREILLKYQSKYIPELYEIFYKLCNEIKNGEIKNRRKLEYIIDITIEEFIDEILKLNL